MFERESSWIWGGAYSYRASKGVIFIAMWYEQLYHISAAGIQSHHFFGSWKAMHLKYCSRHWLMRSVWPSISGWCAVLKCRVTRRAAKISFQTTLVNIVSRSMMITDGGPWSLQMFSMKRSATFCAVYGWAKGGKCAYLVSLSTTTRITFFPLDFGRRSIKSRLISDHFCFGIGRGLSNPGYGTCSPLEIWQTGHSEICCWMNCFSNG